MVNDVNSAPRTSLAHEMFDLSGKLALVAGGAGRLGVATAAGLAERGAQIAIGDLDLRGADEVALRIERHGGAASAWQVDVSRPDEGAGCVDAVVQANDKIDILVVSAGIGIRRQAVALEPKDWQRVIDVNLSGCWFCDQAVGRRMLDGGLGVPIINIGSVVGQVGIDTGNVNYAASKGGIIGLTKCLAVDGVLFGVRVNVVAPTHFRTPLVMQAIRDNPAVEERFLGIYRSGGSRNRWSCGVPRFRRSVDGDGPCLECRRRAYSTMTWDLGAGLEDRGVVVTGATGGIGREVVKAFASAGARLMLVDMDAAACEQLMAVLDGSGHSYRAVDLSDVTSHDGLIEAARGSLGEVYALVHLAAVLRRQAQASDVTEKDWDLQVDTNLKATFFLCRTAAETMVRQGVGGRVVTFTSQGWWTGGFGGSVVYNTTKGGIVTMTRGLARTYGTHNITFKAIAPGQVRTPCC